jgi:hypothetical protein
LIDGSATTAAVAATGAGRAGRVPLVAGRYPESLARIVALAAGLRWCGPSAVRSSGRPAPTSWRSDGGHLRVTQQSLAAASQAPPRLTALSEDLRTVVSRFIPGDSA